MSERGGEREIASSHQPRNHNRYPHVSTAVYTPATTATCTRRHDNQRTRESRMAVKMWMKIRGMWPCSALGWCRAACSIIPAAASRFDSSLAGAGGHSGVW